MLKEAMNEAAIKIMRKNTAGNGEDEPDIDDKIGWTMRLLRVAEKGDTRLIRKCVSAYPNLSVLDQHIQHCNDGQPLPASCLHSIRTHATVLVKANALEKLKALQEEAHNLREDEVRIKRSAIQKQLSALQPGKSNTLSAVLHHSGTVVSDPKSMADALRAHWKDIFSYKAVNEDLLNSWVKEELG